MGVKRVLDGLANEGFFGGAVQGEILVPTGVTLDLGLALRSEEPLRHLFSAALSFANKKARLSVLVRGARQVTYS